MQQSGLYTEDFLQFAWKHGLYRAGKLKTTCGTELEVLGSGVQNFHAGPDFINARIRIGQLVWAGNVEIHRLSSDWEKHGHHLDPSYNNVILHVVRSNDSTVFNQLEKKVLTFVLDIPEQLVNSYASLKAGENWLPCDPYIRYVPDVILQPWLTKLQEERLSEKTGRISGLLLNRGQNWEEVLYTVLAAGLGLPVNSLPFELLVSGIPIKQFQKVRDSLFDLEGILFGQAGLIQTGTSRGPYYDRLLHCYRKHRNRYMGKPLPFYIWKFLRLRPASFPTIRISQFASLVHQRAPLMETLLQTTTLLETEQLLRVAASEYWNTHYMFGKCSPESEKYLGQETIHVVVINALIPFLFSFGKVEGRKDAIELGAYLLSSLKSESNQIIRNWINFGLKPRNAFESQALIQLYKGYCKQKRCLECQIGAGLLEKRLDEEN